MCTEDCVFEVSKPTRSLSNEYATWGVISTRMRKILWENAVKKHTHYDLLNLEVFAVIIIASKYNLLNAIRESAQPCANRPRWVACGMAQVPLHRLQISFCDVPLVEARLFICLFSTSDSIESNCILLFRSSSTLAMVEKSGIRQTPHLNCSLHPLSLGEFLFVHHWQNARKSP